MNGSEKSLYFAPGARAFRRDRRPDLPPDDTDSEPSPLAWEVRALLLALLCNNSGSWASIESLPQAQASWFTMLDLRPCM